VFKCEQGCDILLCSKCVDRGLPSFLFSGLWWGEGGHLAQGVKELGCESDNSSVSSARIRMNGTSYTFIFLYALMASSGITVPVTH
jgi:hypothetical protein